MATIDLTKSFTKLAADGSNWISYSFLLAAWALPKGINLQTCSTDAAAAAALDDDKKQLLYSVIAQTVAETQLKFLHPIQLGDGIAAYNALATIYDSNSRNALVQTLEEVLTLKQSGALDMLNAKGLQLP